MEVGRYVSREGVSVGSKVERKCRGYLGKEGGI